MKKITLFLLLFVAFMPAYSLDISWKELATETAQGIDEMAPSLESELKTSLGIPIKVSSDYTSSNKAINVRMGFYDKDMVDIIGSSLMGELKESFIGGMVEEWAQEPEFAKLFIDVMEENNGIIKLIIYEVPNPSNSNSATVTASEVRRMLNRALK